MGQNKRKVVPVASRHLVCLNCKSWVDFKSSGCGKTWAETRGESFGFTCKGCTEVTVLVKEVEGLKQMVEDMMMGKVTRMRFEDKGEETESRVTKIGANQEREEAAGNFRTEDETSGETGDREATLEEAEEREKCVGENTRDNSPQTGDRVARREEEKEKGEGVLTPYRSDDTSAEDRDAVIETDGEQGTEGDTSRRRMEAKICSGARILATHTYKRNPDSPLGYEIDLQQEDVLSFIMEHEDNEHWWLAEDSKGQVGYVPVSHLMIIVDETIQEEGCDRTRKEVQGKSTDGTKIGEEMGQDGGRRKTYSAAVIDGIKRNSTTYVGDSIVRKTDTRLNKGEDVVVCFPGARIEHVTERVERIMGRGKGGTILVHVGTNNADKEGTTAIVEKYRELLKKTKQARVGQIIISGILPVFGNRIDGYRNSKRMAINGMTKRLCEEENVGYVDLWDSFVGIEKLYARDGLHLSGKGAAAFAEGLSGAVASGLGKVRYLN